MLIHFGNKMNRYIQLAIFVFCVHIGGILTSQAQTMESLRADLQRLSETPGYQKDTAFLIKANELGFMLAESNPDSAFIFLDKQIQWCRSAKYKRGEAEALKIYGNACQNKGDFKRSIRYYEDALIIANSLLDGKLVPGILNNIGLVYYNLGNYGEALQNFYKAIKGAEKVNNLNVKASVLNNISLIYVEQGKLEEAIANYREALVIYSSIGNRGRMILAYNNIGDVALMQNKLDEALENLKIGHESALVMQSPEYIEMTARTIAGVYLAFDSLDKAESFYRKSIAIAKENGYGVPYAQSLIGLADLLYKKGNRKEALTIATEGLKEADTMGQTIQLRNANGLLAKIYEDEGNIPEAFKRFKVFKQFNDSINNLQSQRVAASLESEYAFSKKTLEFEKASQQQRWIIFSAFAGLLTFLIILFIIAHNKRILNKAYQKLQEKTVEIENKNETLEKTLNQLQSTQSQLIQSEKMASLGELTAGIAHEIQNPLNFVNNFSEVSNELIDEMNAELDKGDIEQAKSISTDIKQNLEKINHHGKRADAIVKGMLQHSQSGSGVKEPTDINALADEYLRLAYHGLRAKDKSFNATINTDFDQRIGNINIIPQEIGRVLLNLYNNAFYASSAKALATSDSNYKPTITISTRKMGEKVEMRVGDNGTGIPQEIVDKIFQPFFTTKPTGQGTGLGLSLSYDIVKAHGGELRVETKEGEGSEFIIQLPSRIEGI